MTSADASRPIRTLGDPLAEALGLIGLADARGLQVRLMGGLAFHAQAPTWILELTSSDWGWWRTATGNLEKLQAFLAGDITAAELDVGRPLRFDPTAQIVALRAALDAGPKSTKWKLRARVGERMAWYEEPEEVGHD